jgi:hypothetical protein
LYRYANQQSSTIVTNYQNQNYTIEFSRANAKDVFLKLKRQDVILENINLFELATQIRTQSSGFDKALSLNEMSSTITNEEVELTIVFFFIGIEDGANQSADFDIALLVKFLSK